MSEEKTIAISVDDLRQIEKAWFGLEALAELLEKSKEEDYVKASEVLWPLVRQLGEPVIEFEKKLLETDAQ